MFLNVLFRLYFIDRNQFRSAFKKYTNSINDSSLCFNITALCIYISFYRLRQLNWGCKPLYWSRVQKLGSCMWTLIPRSWPRFERQTAC